MKAKSSLITLCVTCLLSASIATAETLESPAFTVCSQNLENYGLLPLVMNRQKGTTKESFANKEKALVKRITGARCDVVAVEEVIGRNDNDARDGLNQLAAALTLASGREFQSVIAASGDGFIRSGMLLAIDRAKLLQALTYENVELPKLMPQQKPRFFERPPLEVQVEGALDGEKKVITFIVYHLKAHTNAKADATGLEWETYRMEMAEGLRKIIELRHKDTFQQAESLLVILGDRNSDADLATAKIMEGGLTLDNFKTDGPCRLSKRGVPICKAETTNPQELFSVLTLDPETKLLPGTFLFKKEFSWLDDIDLPAASLPFARAKPEVEGNYDSFVVRTFGEASDHALVGVRLRW